MFTRCPNRDCPGRRWQLLKHFAGAMDIDGLGEKQVDLFMKLGWVRTAADFYRLTPEQIAEQPGFGQVSAEKLVEAIEDSKRQPFGRVLFGLGIEEVGYVIGRNLAQHFRTVDALLAASTEEIEQAQGVGPKMAAKIHEQLHDEQMRALIADLRELGLSSRRRVRRRAKGRWPARRSCSPAPCPTLTREQATRDDRRRRRKVTGSVSQEDRLRRRRRQPGSKLAKAEQLGVPVLDEAGLRELLGSADG